MEQIKLSTVILALVQITAIPLSTAQEARYLSDGSTNSRNVVTIDLAQCICSPVANCELTIIKSSLMEVTCGDEENLCCPMTRLTEPVSNSFTLDTPEEDEPAPKPSPVTNVRIYSINTLASDDLASRNSLDEKVKSKAKRNCRCKARSSCPHKYIDYGFGFYCTYNTVRCCIPDDDDDSSLETEQLETTLNETMEIKNEPTTMADEGQEIPNNGTTLPITPDDDVTYERSDLPRIEPEVETVGELETFSLGEELPMPISPLNTEGELQITEVTTWQDSDNDYTKDSQCFCLPIQKCRVTEKYLQNSIERRRDTLCPSELIQCCGFDVIEEITKKKDDTGTEYGVEPITQDLPPFQQPIQLPESDIEEATDSDEATAPIRYTDEVVSSPPSLPTQYQSYEPSGYNKGYNYPANTYSPMLSGPQNYQSGTYENRDQNIGQWVSLSSPSSYSKYAPMIRNQNQGYPRGPYPGQGYAKPVKTGGLLDTFKQFLG